MGKISIGCDIVFVINGNEEEAIRMGSKLSSGLTSFKAIAEELKKLLDIKTDLRDALKLETSTREITKEEIEKEGLVHNSTVANLAKKYPDLDWEGIDLSTKILATDYFKYYGTDLSNYIIKQNGPSGITRIIVIDPDNTEKVQALNEFLRTEAKLRQYSDETAAIIDASEISKVIELLPTIVEGLKKLSDKYNKIAEEYDAAVNEYELLPEGSEERLIKEGRATRLRNRMAKLASDANKYKMFSDLMPKRPKELLLDFMENSSKYYGLAYTLDGGAHSIITELDTTLRLLQGKKVEETNFLDIFANEVASNAKYIPSRDLSSISKVDFIAALNVKLADLRLKRENLADKNNKEYENNLELSRKINHFINLERKTNLHWKEIINTLIDATDDEFSYSLADMSKNVIYLNNVPRTLESRYQDFTLKTLQLLKPVDKKGYRGFTIYISPDGRHYYYSRHILTTLSYGKRYKSVEECKAAIDRSILYNPISQLSLIEFKTRDERDVVRIPNKFIPGQVIKSLNMRFSPYLLLNKIEEDLIYNNGVNNNNTLDFFYTYVMSIVNTRTPETTRKNLAAIINTAEKAACFIYALNEQEGSERDEKISVEALDKILTRIQKAEQENGYEYFVIDSVGGMSTANKYGRKQYSNTVYNAVSKTHEKKQKGTYQTALIPVEAATEINNSLVNLDEDTQRPMPSVRILDELAKKISDKLHIKINIVNQSTLEEKFEEWGHEMPSEVKGFVKNGEIYINSSNASSSDLFHEFTHIVLGALKARNYENYILLVNLVANHDYSKYLKLSMKRGAYKYLAELDLNEEVFAEQFARYLQGRDLGLFLNGALKDARKAVDLEMGSIFGALRITDEFYNADMYNILRLFGYDLGQFIVEGNGLELETGKVYRLASSWIESQIRKYSENVESEDYVRGLDIGIYEDCD